MKELTLFTFFLLILSCLLLRILFYRNWACECVFRIVLYAFDCLQEDQSVPNAVDRFQVIVHICSSVLQIQSQDGFHCIIIFRFLLTDVFPVPCHTRINRWDHHSDDDLTVSRMLDSISVFQDGQQLSLALTGMAEELMSTFWLSLWWCSHCRGAVAAVLVTETDQFQGKAAFKIKRASCDCVCRT